ncbi:MAG: T9SS type A sorting domain-containing protein [Chitinophagales bacterium]|nr:T9SS type A sorting domain-containing protein [Chitinophagales bacterium]
MKKLFLLPIFIFFFATNSTASGGVILQVYVKPTHPTTDDSVKVFFYIYSSTWAYNLLDKSVVSNDSNIIIKRCKMVGAFDSEWWEWDSLNLGKFPLGNYHVTYIINHITSQHSDSTCNSFTQPVDTAYIDFTVSEPNAISVIPVDNDIVIFPNPADNKLNLRLNDSPNDKLIFQILATDGSVIMQDKIINQPNLEIDVSVLPAGLYFIQLPDDKQRFIKRFVKLLTDY